jgi:GNAT superfamily N-acetyltransferase
MTVPGDDTPYRISTAPGELDVDMIHRYLSQESYWAKGISRAVLDRALSHSLCFGGFLGDRQVAFARLVTDRATFANLRDVFVLPAFQRRGLGQAIVQAVMAHPDLQAVTITLGTNDAHRLYQRFGFVVSPTPERSMVRSGTYLKIRD